MNINRKKKILVFDTETACGFKTPMVYDIGGTVIDKDGTVYERFHFLIKEVYDNERLFNTAYYKDKRPLYEELLANGKIQKIPFVDAVNHMTRLIKMYKVKTIAAYNLAFDKNAMRYTAKTLTGIDNWMPLEVEELCIWGAACDVLYHKKFIRTAKENGWISECGNVKTGAEFGYRYISGDYDFIEKHMGLYDSDIEAAILVRIYKQHKKFNGAIRYNPWKEVMNRAA